MTDKDKWCECRRCDTNRAQTYLVMKALQVYGSTHDATHITACLYACMIIEYTGKFEIDDKLNENFMVIVKKELERMKDIEGDLKYEKVAVKDVPTDKSFDFRAHMKDKT